MHHVSQKRALVSTNIKAPTGTQHSNSSHENHLHWPHQLLIYCLEEKDVTAFMPAFHK